jgi:hypothetical protein
MISPVSIAAIYVWGRALEQVTAPIGFVLDGSCVTAALAMDGGTKQVVVRRRAVGGIAQESVIVAGNGTSHGCKSGVRIAVTGCAWCGPDATFGTANIVGRCGFGVSVIALESVIAAVSGASDQRKAGVCIAASGCAWH